MIIYNIKLIYDLILYDGIFIYVVWDKYLILFNGMFLIVCIILGL